jgi:APA family basic amino acid/polyamine antiporter
VAFVYIICSFVIMGIIPAPILAQSKAPFADAAAIIFGGNWHLLISIAAAIVCLGTLNAWVLTSGQIALGAANDDLFPSIFKKKNHAGAPVWSLIISSVGMIPLLILTMDINLINQINTIIDISVTAFLFVYVMCVLSYLKLFYKKKNNSLFDIGGLLVGVCALIFCGWALWASGLKTVSLAFLITLSGIPVFLWQKRHKKPNQQYSL